jgi:hypothetical protein
MCSDALAITVQISDISYQSYHAMKSCFLSRILFLDSLQLPLFSPPLFTPTVDESLIIHTWNEKSYSFYPIPLKFASSYSPTHTLIQCNHHIANGSFSQDYQPTWATAMPTFIQNHALPWYPWRQQCNRSHHNQQTGNLCTFMSFICQYKRCFYVNSFFTFWVIWLTWRNLRHMSISDFHLRIFCFQILSFFPTLIKLWWW